MINKDDFYKHIEFWIKQKLSLTRTRPLFIGINGPQGVGKSTLSKQIVHKLNSEGIATVCISVDDFYLTHQDQKKMADESQNPYWQERGYPGTHDLQLGAKILESLKNQKSTLIPVYNKSAFQGEGDRCPEEDWKSISSPQDVVILEGWMLGFQPIDQPLPKPLQAINSILAKYDQWNQYLDIFLYLKPLDLSFVVDWRIEAEKNRRDLGLGGMTDEQAKNYVSNFLIAYETYSETVELMKKKVQSYLEIPIQKNRLPASL